MTAIVSDSDHSETLLKVFLTLKIITPLKNPAQRAGGTKPEALVPEEVKTVKTRKSTE